MKTTVIKSRALDSSFLTSGNELKTMTVVVTTESKLANGGGVVVVSVVVVVVFVISVPSQNFIKVMFVAVAVVVVRVMVVIVFVAVATVVAVVVVELVLMVVEDVLMLVTVVVVLVASGSSMQSLQPRFATELSEDQIMTPLGMILSGPWSPEYWTPFTVSLSTPRSVENASTRIA